MKYTTTVADYLRWRGDIPFSADPFNEVDNLVLCIVSYLNFRRFPELLTRNPKEAVLLRDISQKLTEEDEQLGLSRLAYIPVVQQAAQTERFADVRMFAFEDRSDEEAQMQFAAVSFLLPDGSCDLTPCPKRNLPVFARFGIRADCAADYHADSIGTEAVYESVCEAVCQVRSSAPLKASWKQRIDADFKGRKR